MRLRGSVIFKRSIVSLLGFDQWSIPLATNYTPSSEKGGDENAEK